MHCVYGDFATSPLIAAFVTAGQRKAEAHMCKKTLFATVVHSTQWMKNVDSPSNRTKTREKLNVTVFGTKTLKATCYMT